MNHTGCGENGPQTRITKAPAPVASVRRWGPVGHWLAAFVALVLLLGGCSKVEVGPKESGAVLYKPVPGQVTGELKPAGEDEFLAGDYKTARPLLTTAGRNGSLRAVFFLRVIVEHGLDGQKPDQQEADRLTNLMAAMRERLHVLANNGPEADRHIYQASLALIYFRGLVATGQDLSLALELARQASAKGFRPAMNLTAAILLTPGLEVGLLKDLLGGGLSEAFYLSHTAAEKNDVLAMGNVGYLYRTGQGVDKDAFQGASWARKAADVPQTTPRVFNDLGAIYEDGLAVTKDKAEALKWYEKAASRGYPGASANVSRLKAEKTGAAVVLNGLEY